MNDKKRSISKTGTFLVGRRKQAMLYIGKEALQCSFHVKINIGQPLTKADPTGQYPHTHFLTTISILSSTALCQPGATPLLLGTTTPSPSHLTPLPSPTGTRDVPDRKAQIHREDACTGHGRLQTENSVLGKPWPPHPRGGKACGTPTWLPPAPHP